MEKKVSPKKQHKLFRNPYVAAIIVLLWSILVTNVVTGIFSIPNIDVITYSGSVIAGVLLLIIHKAWFRDEYDGSFTKSGLKHKDVNIYTLLAFIATFLIGILPAWIQSGVNAPSLEAFVHGLSAGVFEEAMSRALMVSVMMRVLNKPKDVKIPVIFTAVAFSLIHLFNIIAGADVGATMVQLVSAGAAGVFFAAIFLRTGNVLFPIIFHSLYDMLCFMQKGSESGIITKLSTLEVVTALIHAVFLIVVSVILLKNHEEEITELWKIKWKKEDPAEVSEI